MIPKRGPGRPPAGTKAKGNRTFRPEEDVEAFLEEAREAGLEMTSVINRALRIARALRDGLGVEWWREIEPRIHTEGISEGEVISRLVKLGLEAEKRRAKK